MTENAIEPTSTNANQPGKTDTNTGNDAEFLSSEETREILTPFAFKIDKSLYGIALATPQRRLIALLVDLLLVAMFSGAPGELLALLIAIVLFRFGSKKRAQQMGKVKGTKRRAIVRFIGAFIVFVLLLDYLPKLISDAEEIVDPASKPAKVTQSREQLAQEKANELKVEQAIAFAAVSAKALTTVSNSQCSQLGIQPQNQQQQDLIALQSEPEIYEPNKQVDCWYNELSPIVNALPELSLPKTQVLEGIDVMSEVTDMPLEQQRLLTEKLRQSYLAEHEKVLASNIADEQQTLDDENVTSTDQALRKKPVEDDPKYFEAPDNFYQANEENKVQPIEKEKEKPVYSVIELIKGIIDDLGLGFGWAAFYFTVFTALWRGQTPGKKLMGIKVLQLDGTPLSLWDSFGRYGGYGAGIATGLLGFIQIFWNPNRQAIHDQISSTVVVFAGSLSEFKAHNHAGQSVNQGSDNNLTESETTAENKALADKGE